MDTITQEVRDSIYLSATLPVKFLYSHPQSGIKLKEIAMKHNMNEKYYEFAITIGDIILGFYKIGDTVPLLQQELGLDPKTAALLGADVLEFLAPLSDPNWQPPVDMTETDEATEGTESVMHENPQSEEPVNRIPLKSPALYATPAMAQPAPVTTPVFEPAPVGYGVPAAPAPTPIYSSTQPVMSAAPTLSPIPSYTPAPTPPVVPPPAPAPDRPRWSTEI